MHIHLQSFNVEIECANLQFIGATILELMIKMSNYRTRFRKKLHEDRLNTEIRFANSQLNGHILGSYYVLKCLATKQIADFEH